MNRRRMRSACVVAPLILAAAAVLAGVPTAAQAAPSTSPSNPTATAAVPTSAPGSASTGAPTTGAPASAAPTDSAAAAQAQAAANAAAGRVTTLTAGVRRAQAALSAASTAAARADAALSAQVATEATAAARLTTATATLQRSQLAYATAHRAYVTSVADQYESGNGPMSGAAQLLLATDPGQLVATQELGGLVTGYRSSTVARDHAAERALTTAQDELAAARTAAHAATTRLTALQTAAHTAVATATTGLATLRARLAAAKLDQAATDTVLTRFLGGWSTADPARADALNRRYLAAARRHPEFGTAPLTPHWTSAQGLAAAWRAVMWIGTPYAWAGGNAAGPTTGICAGGGAQNDCHLTGFDCSGLALYAWAPYLSMPHDAATQYRVAGRIHPAIDALLPGDLVFWSSDGQASGIHHVAIYVGDGNVVQAPESGDIVRVTPLGSVDAGYFGATRPRT